MLWNWLRRLRQGPSRADWQIILYTRQGCHLCEDAWALLEQARHQYGFALSTVDVDHDAELARQFGDQVPVVAVNGRVRFRGIINRVLLYRMLRAG
jgi:glutaredoxin